MGSLSHLLSYFGKYLDDYSESEDKCMSLLADFHKSPALVSYLCVLCGGEAREEDAECVMLSLTNSWLILCLLTLYKALLFPRPQFPIWMAQQTR